MNEWWTFLIIIFCFVWIVSFAVSGAPMFDPKNCSKIDSSSPRRSSTWIAVVAYARTYGLRSGDLSVVLVINFG